MASTLSLTLHQTRSLHRVRNVHSASSKAHAVKPAPSLSFCDRRQLMLSLTVGTVLTTKDSPSMAVDIPLFGLRKKLEKVEEEAVEVVKEGIETAEKGIETVEKEVETAEREIETAVSFGGLAQAGAVAGAEVVGILVATSIVNSILGPEAQKS